MSDFHYGIYSKKEKKEAGKIAFKNTLYLNDELENFTDKFKAAMKLLGITFDADGCEAYFSKPKEEPKK